VRAFAQRSKQPSLPLVQAADTGDIASVERLVAAGADMNAATSNGMTPLMCAAQNGHIEIVSLLVARGADVYLARNDGATALTLAAFYGHHDVVRALVSSGSRLSTTGSSDPSPEDWASSRVTEIPELLKAPGSGDTSPARENGSQQKTVLTVPTDSNAAAASEDVSQSPSEVKDEFGWLRRSEGGEVFSPASQWAPDEQNVLRSKAEDIKAPAMQRPHDIVSEIDWVETSGVKEVSRPSIATYEHEKKNVWWSRPDIFEAPEEMRVNVPETPERAPEQPEPSTSATSPPFGDAHESNVAAANAPKELEVLGGAAASTSAATHGETATRELVSPAGTPVQSKAVAGEAPNTFIASPKGITPRTLVLDESAVLPSEASFATVALHREIPSSNLLDQSADLSNEGSFATLSLFQETRLSHSPKREFVAKVTLGARRVLPTLLLVALCGAAIITGLKVLSALGSFDSPPVGNRTTKTAVPKAKNPASQTQVESNSTAAKPSTALDTPSSPSPSVVGDTTVNNTVAATSETSEITPPGNVQKRKTRSYKNAQSAPKESVVTKKDVPATDVGPSDAPAQSAAKTSTEPASNPEKEESKSKAESQAAPSGGAERPRRTKKETDPDSPANPSPTESPLPPEPKASKPKLIPWP
jgi:Ankyrin repeats (3 copies)